MSLNETHLLSGIKVQGRYDRGKGQEYTEEFEIEYWREGFNEWRKYYKFDGKTVSQLKKRKEGILCNLFHIWVPVLP